MSDCATKLSFLNDLPLSTYDRQSYESIKNNDFTVTSLRDSLKRLCYLVYQYVGVKPVVLVDEYDVPLSKVSDKDFYEKFKEDVAQLLGSALKDCEYVTKSVITGCLRIAKESIFSDFNNFSVNSVTSTFFGQMFGFTKSEIDNLLSYYGFEKDFQTVKDWYDGYNMCGDEVYCPWDVVEYCYAKFNNSNTQPRAYWVNSGSYPYLKKVFDKNPLYYPDDFSTLLQGGSISFPYREEINYQMLESMDDPNLFWTLMLHAGYVTPIDVNTVDSKLEIKIPNLCIKRCFEDLAKFYTSASNPLFCSFVSSIVSNAFNGKASDLEDQITEALNIATSFFDFGKHTDQESYYHSFLSGCLVSFIDVEKTLYKSNFEVGNGRPDICFFNFANDVDKTVGVLIEVKVAKSDALLEETCQNAIKQIEDKKYYEGLFKQTKNLTKVNAYAIAFHAKSCKVVLKQFIRG